ncbi:uncharacterized protein JCM6883_002403 [Sporobolomyces salmoneus]|uniref:uncharacterized protein n=1 Tax=Sporobolomyces salmoneus TaxID=183962 RepID=UPI00317DC56C
MAPSLQSSHHHHQQPDSSSTATAKGQHYAQTLDLARRLSLFTAQYPAELKTGNINRNRSTLASSTGAGMDWNELLRKFRKHDPHRPLTAATAQTDQLIHTLLSKTPAPPALAANEQLPPLPPILPSSSHPALLTSLASLTATNNSSTSTQLEIVNAKIVTSFGKYLVGESRESLRELEGVELEMPRSGGPVELYDLTLRVLGHAVRGLSLERLNAPLVEARDSYRLASRQYEQAVETISKSTNVNGATEDVSLHRIGETVLWRLCHIDGVISSPQQAYTSHLLYIRLSNFYHTFSPSSLSSSLTPYPVSRSFAIHSSFHQLSLSTSNFSDSSFVNRAEESLLRKSTTLPKAGRVNQKYLGFLDRVMERWKEGGSDPIAAGEVVEILYNALSHTFQSHLLLRSLIRTLTVSTRYVEAQKALKLYVELWDKARETDAKRVAQEMKTLRKRSGFIDEGEKLNEKGDLEPLEEKEEEEEEHDIDSDREFLEIGAFGVRLLCRYLNEPEQALNLAKRMKEVWKEGKEVGLKEDREVQTKVEGCLGVALACLAQKEANPLTRPTQHASSLSHLTLASSLSPTFNTLYQLSYQLLELRQVSRSVEIAKQAVQLDKDRTKGWHLLGIGLMSLRDYRGALQVLEEGIEIDSTESLSEEEEVAEEGTKEAALAKLEGKPTTSSISASASATRRRTIQERWDYPLSATEKLVESVQIRLSKNVLIEYLEGPASALEDQQELLAWFSRAYAPIGEALLLSTPPPTNPSPLDHLTESLGSTHLSKRKSLLGRRVSLGRSKRDSSSVPPSSSSRPATTTALSVPPGLSPDSVSSTPYASAVPSRVQSRNTSTVSLVVQPTLSASTANPSKPDMTTNRLATRLLQEIWLASAASFKRAGKFEESKGAIWEAEQLDSTNPDVWASLASLQIAQGETSLARKTLQKAFSFETDHLPSLILFSRLYLTPPSSSPSPSSSSSSSSWVTTQLPFAESLLDTLTQKQGWDSPEAWFELSKCYKETGRKEKEKECLVWALQLEETRGLRGLGKSLGGRVL